LRSPVRVAASALFLSVALSAQTSRSSPFADIKRLDCTFTISSSLTWAAGEPHFDVKEVALTFQLNNIDTDQGSARFAVGAANTTVVASLAGSMVHFIDRRPDGSMAMTSVFSSERRQEKFRAVYSRTEYYAYDGPGFRSMPQVEQLYGYCAPLP